MPEDIDIFTDCGLSSKVTLWKGVTSGIFLSKMIHGLWVAIPGILSVSSQNFKMAAEVLHVLICKCSRQEEMEGVLISCRVFSYYGEKSFAKHLHQISTYEDLTGSLVVTNLTANAGDIGSIPGLERFHLLWGKLDL